MKTHTHAQLIWNIKKYICRRSRFYLKHRSPKNCSKTRIYLYLYTKSVAVVPRQQTNKTNNLQTNKRTKQNLWHTNIRWSILKFQQAASLNVPNKVEYLECKYFPVVFTERGANKTVENVLKLIPLPIKTLVSPQICFPF